MESQESQLHGLTWVEETFGSETGWTIEPDIGAITKTVQSLRPSSTVEVTFLAQGGFNKIYNVSIDDKPSILRVSLPVDSRYKVMSEVATMDWVRRITSLPIPRVITYQPSRDNLVGFEWMLMTEMPGKPFLEDPDSDGEDEVKDATRTLKIIDNLRSLLPLVFPTADDNPEPSMIFHDDLSRGNILVDDSGELTGVLGWESVCPVPLWKVCDYPSFLEGRPRRQEPVIGRYGIKDNGQPSELYFEHLWEYETTLLRGIFIDEMRRLDEGWVEVFDNSQIKRDFDYAVHYCDCCISTRHIEAWIGDMTAGISNLRSLEDRIYSP
ncbi:Aminoglycoside phosphotransferase [Penicillium griseofulvum]|uniref:Aminoglycoside phosphotransferase n=1 Tax=Penicillium patulum TaxID=5078 RepID=A0A135LG57_PENPA|nr:Aminoglycoside phosphotransferase [Penicillium griseofulvum]KXG47949.1 Aminoglycoside phosphotransferase [Penicillium griseofulvum]